MKSYFRVEYLPEAEEKKIRLFAFWDKEKPIDTVVIATHGIVKKTSRIPGKEIVRRTPLETKLYDYEQSISNQKEKPMKTTSLDNMIDKHIGKVGSSRRDTFENELRMDLIGHAIREARIRRNLTQKELGELVGVQKAQISKLENSLSDARLETILKVFKALNAKIQFRVEL